MSKTSKKIIADTKLSKKDTLQAVVLADDFTESLYPVHDVCPSIMMTVANVRLLDYLMETLTRSHVQELFLYCSKHVDTLKEYVASKRYKDIVVSLIISDACTLGDALRDIYNKGLVRSDFILIRGDAFTNANLNDLMALHRAKCQEDKNTAVTLIFRDLGCTGESSLSEQSCMFVADRRNKEVLFYKQLSKDDKRVQLELEWFLNHDEIEINSSYVDTHIYLCSSTVLPLFADNFDFQTMEHFLRCVLLIDEIQDSKIYWQPLKSEEYALPITSWQAYHCLSRDILQRQGYPLTPDMLPPLRNIVYMPRSTYKHRTATLARGCTLKRDTIVGENSILGKNTFVTRSVIGENCKIGDNVRIENSHILSNVTIRDNCKIDSCVLFSNCELDQNCQLDACILLPGINLSSKSQYIDSTIETMEKKIIAKKMSEHDDESNEKLSYYRIRDTADFDDYSDTEECSSKTSSICGSPLPDDTNMFLSEVIDSLLRGYQDKLNCDNLILEINSSRYAYNVSIREVTYNVVKAILMLPLHYLTEQKTTIDYVNYQKILKVMITYFNPIIMKYIKTEDAQEDCLRAIQDVASTTLELLSFVQLLMHTLYDRDILSEEKILEWFDNVVDDEEEMKKGMIRSAVAPFIMWLKEAEEDSSEDNEG